MVCLPFCVAFRRRTQRPPRISSRKNSQTILPQSTSIQIRARGLCAANTRTEIQADIKQWLSPQPSNCAHIFWIMGIAGSGKSTLSATIVNNLRQEGTPVAAQFFISRNIPETIDPSKIIPTLAKQLAESSLAAAHIIHGTLRKGFPPSQKEQVQTLLLAPIQELSKSSSMVIIVIDALDE
ncbi:hypothetical protein B0H14DRAFT_2340348, partial [Mycena olivaceomarginata]